MANVFKNSVTGSIGVTETTVYSVPVSTVATIIGLSVANVISSNINVSVKVTDTSAGKTVFIVKDALIPNNTSVVLIGGEQKLVMEATDVLSVVSSSPNSADVVTSLLEIS